MKLASETEALCVDAIVTAGCPCLTTLAAARVIANTVSAMVKLTSGLGAPFLRVWISLCRRSTTVSFSLSDCRVSSHKSHKRQRDKTRRQEKIKEERRDKTREDERGETRQDKRREVKREERRLKTREEKIERREEERSKTREETR